MPHLQLAGILKHTCTQPFYSPLGFKKETFRHTEGIGDNLQHRARKSTANIMTEDDTMNISNVGKTH